MKSQEFLNNSTVVHFTYEIPQAELVTDFFDKLKSISSDYEFVRYEDASIVKVIFHLNGDPIDALTFHVHDSRAVDFAKRYCSKLKDLLPAQLFKIAIQGKICGKVIALEDIKARKDVTAKCYGGDITKKNKLLEKQKVGKKKMKARMLGQIPVDSEVFLRLLKQN